MKKISPLLFFFLIPFLITAQSVLITPGAQSLNGDSTIQNQLNAFGNGLLVGPKVKFTDEDPASNIYTMNLASPSQVLSNAGTLKDPNGDSDYIGELAHNSNFSFYPNGSGFMGYEISFDILDTEANGDSVYIYDNSTNEVVGVYSGGALPSNLIVTSNFVRINFVTDSDANVGSGFVLKWKAIYRDGSATAIENYVGQGLVYDVVSNSLWSGVHESTNFENKGEYSTALGRSTIAKGINSTALGYRSEASGNYAMAMGRSVSSEGTNSVAIGYLSNAIALNSTAIGGANNAIGVNSTALGTGTESIGENSISLGIISKAIGYSSTAMGTGTEAVGSYSMAMGSETRADSTYATAMGKSTLASGYSSTAMGEDTEASGSYSIAMGRNTTASGYISTAMGDNTTADGLHSTAMGQYTTATGSWSTAMGEANNALGDGATAIGGSSTASGKYSTTIGLSNSTIGDYSIAMGRSSTAGGNYSVAIGKDVTANGDGTLIVGDSNPGGLVYTSGTSDKFIARFYNGYYFLTSATGATATGVSIGHGQTAWSSISDSTKKENFIPADGDAFLEKLKGLRLGSWNYKTQDENPERFYGPMAQEIFAAYGKDTKGTIGSDTLVSTLNMDGLLFIFAQELEKRTSNLKNENDELKRSNKELKQSVVSLEKDLKMEIMEIKASLNAMLKGDAVISEASPINKSTKESR